MKSPDLIDEPTLKRWKKALHTQYQLHGDYSITPRRSEDAPTIEQLSEIREAHLNIINLVNTCLFLHNESNES